MKVLISDDNYDYCTTIADIVQSYGYDTLTISNPHETINYLDSNHKEVGVLLLDIEFGPDSSINGINVLEHCRLNYPELPVVMISGKGSISTAVKATKLGARNFIEKSIINKNKIKEILDSSMQSESARGYEKEIRNFLESQGIIGRSKVLLELGDAIVRYGRTDLNVLVTGETGTGKKLVAKALHAISYRSKFPFVTVDIPNIPHDLFQSELFGHNKGSFSGAINNKEGLFKKANKGTIFLDEIGDLSMSLQANLFIPIEEKVIRKVGSTEAEEINVRFVSATDKDLLIAMQNSKFREQLFHRLRECEIFIPPLKERKEDIPDIVEYYIKKFNVGYNKSKLFAPTTIEYLQDKDWDGNIRELVSVIRLALQTSQKDQIEIPDIHKILQTTRQAHSKIRKTDTVISYDKTLKEDLQKVDKKKIIATLELLNGNVSKSAVHLGVSRETLHNKIRKYGIKTQEYRRKKL